jgi:hypothetical protein
LAQDAPTESPVIPSSIQEEGQITPDTPQSFARKLGLAWTTPATASATQQRNEQGIDVLYLMDEATPPGWSITFQRINVGELGETTSSQIDALLDSLPSAEETPASRQVHALRERRALGVRLLGGTDEQLYPAELVYLDLGFAGAAPSGITGLLVIQTAPKSFIYGTLFAMPDEFDERVAPTLDTLYGSLRILSESGQTQNDGSRINEGMELLARFTPETLRAVAEKDIEEFYRIYATDPEGTIQEIGWQQVTTRLATCSEVPGTNAGEDVSMDEGLLVTIKSEVVEFFPSQKLTVDIVASHWISLDRQEGRWSIIRTPRRILSAGGNRTETEVGSPTAETGIRTRPTPKSNITVVDSDGLYVRLEVPTPPAPFISQPELHVLGHLLEETDSDAFDLDWYSLDRKNLNGAGIRKRSDRCTASSDGSTLEISTLGGSGRFIQRFDGTGRRLIRRSPLQGGGELILESIDPRDLIDLYTRKDLPVR